MRSSCQAVLRPSYLWRQITLPLLDMWDQWGRGDETQRVTDAYVCEMRQEIGVDYTQHVGAKYHLWRGFSLCFTCFCCIQFSDLNLQYLILYIIQFYSISVMFCSNGIINKIFWMCFFCLFVPSSYPWTYNHSSLLMLSIRSITIA